MKRAGIGGLLVVSVAAAAATLTDSQRDWYRGRLGLASAGASMPTPNAVGEAILRWKRLQQSDSWPFDDYAGFLLAYPGWPGETAMRKSAEARIDPSVAPQSLIRFFDRFPPITTTAKARYAEALAATGRADTAREAARAAWVSGALSPDDEMNFRARFAGVFTPADHDRRMDRLLWDRATAAAQRQIASVSPAARPLFDARLAMQTRAPDAEARALSIIGMGAGDPGFVADRARYLRDNNRSVEARGWLATPRSFAAPPLDAEKWLEILLLNARAAAADNQSSVAYAIAQRADSAFPVGTVVRERTIGERDDYTSLVWLGGITAFKKLGRPADAQAMFESYAAAAQSPQTQSKGLYWAGRAALASGRATLANQRFAEAARNPDQFYGQLSSERLGQMVATPTPPALAIAPADRAAFEASSIVRATRMLGELGAWKEQSAFLRTIASSARTDVDHALAADLSRAIGRPDLGVMVARAARNNGVSDFVPTGFPELPVPSTEQGRWVMIHAITRQESQFDREAISHAGARGLMQLMPATAREQAGKIGLGYDMDRLTSDPTYNILLGSTFFQRLLDYYGGNHMLSVAAYNAGPGNVNKWLRSNGDPRTGAIDVLDWIEAIPLSETRGYVQRVLENAVVYDALNPARARMPERNRLSAYLGKRTPG